MNKDALMFEYSELLSQLNGISPKLALHKEIKAKMDAIRAKVGDWDITPTKIQETRTKKGRYINKYR